MYVYEHIAVQRRLRGAKDRARLNEGLVIQRQWLLNISLESSPFGGLLASCCCLPIACCPLVKSSSIPSTYHYCDSRQTRYYANLSTLSWGSAYTEIPPISASKTIKFE